MDVRDIEREIRKLEVGDVTLSSVQQLALLYTVRDHLKSEPEKKETENRYSYAAPPKKSDFRAAALEAPFEGLLDVLTEHFESIRRTYPKEYAMVVDKINDLI